MGILIILSGLAVVATVGTTILLVALRVSDAIDDARIASRLANGKLGEKGVK